MLDEIVTHLISLLNEIVLLRKMLDERRRSELETTIDIKLLKNWRKDDKLLGYLENQLGLVPDVNLLRCLSVSQSTVRTKRGCSGQFRITFLCALSRRG